MKFQNKISHNKTYAFNTNMGGPSRGSYGGGEEGGKINTTCLNLVRITPES